MNKKSDAMKHVSPAIVFGLLAAAYPDRYRQMLFFLLSSVKDPVRQIINLFRFLPETALALVVYIGIIILFLVSLVRALAHLAGSGRLPAGTRQKKSVTERQNEREIRKEQRSYMTAYKSGKERYIDQLDELLRSGLIEQKEYRYLKKKYSEMNIPGGF